RFLGNDLPVFLDYFNTLYYRFQIAVAIALTAAARYASMIRQNILQRVADKRVSALFFVGKKICDGLECLPPIKVISIDYCKWLVDNILGAKHGVSGAPRF